MLVSRRRSLTTVRCASGGFTLVDMVVTVLIIGILAAAVAPRFANTIHAYRADAAAQRLQADLGWARQHAISSSAVVIVQFSPGSSAYTISGVMHLDQGGQPYDVDLLDDPYQASVTAPTFGGDNAVQFDRFGQPDSGGTITVTSGGSSQTVTIDADTGRASIP
ncbi:Type II transport protein GspH [Maioricimonas rarisocia]|uniref:Type II secretion system protein H n=1 Tax=Maioricimonas rarisocia TaxID=2528026 RepID=A0A517ZCC5_9PLAN|nr:GspH/FimT family pseudopilin [Maioricimonas rarisocia]QDU40153.1 Type II transport protein GspH [Maioricimonas rarisocia]